MSMGEGESGQDKSGFRLKAIGGFLASALLALLGFVTNNYLQKKEERDAKLKLYTELMSKREESDTNIREQMLSLMMNTFLGDTKGDLEQKVLGLELLSQNFHESIEISSLFRHVRMRIGESTEAEAKKDDHLKRLERVAREVAGKQIEILQEPGYARFASVDFDELSKSPAGMQVFDNCFPLHAEDAALPAASPAENPAPLEASNKRCLRVQVLAKDINKKELRLRLLSSAEGDDVDVPFALDYFDFPMVDNTHLSHNQRCAVVLQNFGEDSADLALVYFPASHASLRDKPYYDELVHDLVASKGEQPRK
jgi:hypothetical protein